MKGIVIGAGSSLYDSHVLDDIVRSQFKGSIVIADRALKECIMRGLDPKYFNIFCVTNEVADPNLFPRKLGVSQMFLVLDFFINRVVLDKKLFFKIFLPHIFHNRPFNIIKNNGFQFTFFNRKFKDPSKFIPNKPIIESCGNGGGSAYNIARQLLGCDQIALLGVDLIKSRYDLYEYSWNTERSLTEKCIDKYSFECSAFNLSPLKSLKSKLIINCTLEEFLKDSYELETMKYKGIVE